MDKANENTEITASDLKFIEVSLKQNVQPFTLDELTKKLAYQKTSSQLSHEVKIYDPNGKYEIGDLICKEYDEPLTVSSKGIEDFAGTVVLRVVGKVSYEGFSYEMLEVDYTGGGIFRKYIDYMKKTKTQVLLPSNFENRAEKPAMLKKEDDPRLKELPMTDKDFKTLEKNLKLALSKSEKFFNWSHYWDLVKNQVTIPSAKMKEIESYFVENKRSASTSELVSKFFKLPPEDDRFAMTCLSLNAYLDKHFRKSFIFVSPIGWGKWIHKKILDGFMQNISLAAPKAVVPKFEEESKETITPTPDFPLKVYLSWREIHSGGIKIPAALNREFSRSKEYIFTDDDKKEYTLYYYPNHAIFLGMKEYYRRNNIPQGASLSLERRDKTQIAFSLKKAKKKQSVPMVTYNEKTDVFTPSDKDVMTPSMPNKIIHLERETMTRLAELSSQKEDLDLRELLTLVFKTFGLEGEALSLHYLRAFHLVDMIKHTTLEEVENTLLSAPEFAASERNIGIFLYQEKIKTEEEILPEEEPQEISDDIFESSYDKEENLPEIGTVGEIDVPDLLEEIIPEEPIPEESESLPPKTVLEELKPEEPLPSTPEPEIPAPKPEKEKTAPPKKEAKKKKRRMKIEGEAAPKRRKGEKKLIEERIELEESEMEALFAVKAEDKKEDLEIPTKSLKSEKPKKQTFKTEEAETPLSGMFAAKLKSALDQKKGKPKTAKSVEKKKAKPPAKKKTK